MFTRVRHKFMRSHVVTHKTAKITMLLRHVHMLVRISITQEGNLFHERLFMKYPLMIVHAWTRTCNGSTNFDRLV